MNIDAHQHYWKVDRGDYGWLTPESGVLYRDYLPSELRMDLDRCGIAKTVVVQAAPTVEETEFLLGLADQESTISGVVGWLDLDSDDFPQQLANLRRHPKFVGVRPMLQDLPEDDWILRPRVTKHVGVLVEQDVPLDILVFPRHLPYVLEVLRRFPNLWAVVDHLAKPYIRDGILQPWDTQMEQVAAYPNIMCKLSGMVTEADTQTWTEEDLRPYVEHVVKVFGSRRVMFGSDWPVCLQAATYEQVLHALERVLPTDLSSEERAAIFGGNAQRFYHLDL